MNLETLRKKYDLHLVGAVEASTRSWYNARLDAIIRATKALTVEQLSPEVWVAYRNECGLAASSCNADLRILKALLNWAGLNPLSAVKCLPQTDSTDRRALVEDECQRLIVHPKRGLFWDVMISTGVRKCEFRRITRNMFDLQGRNLSLSAKITKRKRFRKIPFGNRLAARLKESLPDQPGAVCFRNGYGRPWPGQNALLGALRRDLKWAEINPNGVTLHSLRYTCATRLIAAGVDIKTVQYILGHADARLTLDIYTKHQDRHDPNLEKAFNFS